METDCNRKIPFISNSTFADHVLICCNFLCYFLAYPLCSRVPYPKIGFWWSYLTLLFSQDYQPNGRNQRIVVFLDEGREIPFSFYDFVVASVFTPVDSTDDYMMLVLERLWIWNFRELAMNSLVSPFWHVLPQISPWDLMSHPLNVSLKEDGQCYVLGW